MDRVTSVLGVGGLESLLMYYSLKEVVGKWEAKQKASQSCCPGSLPGVFVCNLDYEVAEAFCSETK